MSKEPHISGTNGLGDNNYSNNNSDTDKDFPVCSSAIEVSEFVLPTPEEERTLRHVVERFQPYIYFVCLIEFAERASYYATGDRFDNFFMNPLPVNGNGAGAPFPKSEDSAGALGLGLPTATALKQLFKFSSYFFPLITGYIADKYVGHLKMLWFGVVTGILSHIILIIAAIPRIILMKSLSTALSIIGLLTLSICTAMVKPVLLPLLLRQYPHQTNVVTTLKSGERVILDREATMQRMTLTFYWAINIGGFLSIATSYSALHVGFWLAFLIPLALYLIVPVSLLYGSRHIKDTPPSGVSVLSECLKVLKVCFEKGWTSRRKAGTFWDYAKPSNLKEKGRIGWRKNKPGFYDESLVDDTKITLCACSIFVSFVIYSINDNQLGTIVVNQSNAMTKNGVPNDVLGNLNALVIILLIPFLNNFLYPLLRRMRINVKPVQRIFLGFMIAVAASVAGALTQWRVYSTSPCGNNASTCAEKSPISVWVVSIQYILTGVSECLAMTTGYELAFDHSPKRMQSFVMALFLFTTALASLVVEIFSPLFEDPHLVVPFVIFAVLGTIDACGFLWRFRNLYSDTAARNRATPDQNSDASISETYSKLDK